MGPILLIAAFIAGGLMLVEHPPGQEALDDSMAPVFPEVSLGVPPSHRPETAEGMKFGAYGGEDAAPYYTDVWIVARLPAAAGGPWSDWQLVIGELPPVALDGSGVVAVPGDPHWRYRAVRLAHKPAASLWYVERRPSRPKIGVRVEGSIVGVLPLPALEDAEPPSTTLQVCSGGLPSLSLLGSAQNGCHSVDVSATEVASADQILYFPQSFSHVFRDGSSAGDPACIFTAQPGDHPGEVQVGTASGGRDCRPEDHQCAYIAQGWHTWAVTGQSCMEAGVPACTGPFCT